MNCPANNKNNKESDYKLYPDGRFVIKNYNTKKPFSNFLPGIAGLFGTPMWVFYVNRGQGIASFGTKDKDNAILEFFPANKAYQTVTTQGFRTFIKCSRSGGPYKFHEPFREPAIQSPGKVEQRLEMSSHEFSVEEINHPLGLKITVRYFTVPGEPFAVLARELSLENISGAGLRLELLDGLPSVNSYGMNEWFAKNMSRTIEAWMIAENVSDHRAPFFRLRVDATDRPEVVAIEEGNFYFSCLEDRAPTARLLDPVVDGNKIFGSKLDFSEPKAFYQEPLFKGFAGQIMENKTPCAFSFASLTIGAGQSKRILSYFGHAKSLNLLNRYVEKARRRGYFDEKRLENLRLIEGLKAPMFTASASAAYDLYCGQTYLDNLMRGGTPVHLGNRDKDLVFHVCSRKHGDLERDYNHFLLEPTYFSQGDGNYRDVNQNRRDQVWFDPAIRELNIKTFLNLIQLDGFNPLVIKGVRFHLKRTDASKRVLVKFFGKKNAEDCLGYLAQPFTPGPFYRFLEERKWIAQARFRELLRELVPFISKEEQAEHGDGFWIDHWTYNLDLIESYLAIFPESWKPLLFEQKEFTYYDNDYRVNPRHLKYFIQNGSSVRQFKAVVKDKEKSCLIAKRRNHKTLVRTRHGRGEVYKTTLFAKLLCLFTNKFASLDAEGIGVEMESDKPSWLDALNGLPGLLGSSLPETFELKRLALFLIQSLEDLEIDLNENFLLPEELYEFIHSIAYHLERHFETNASSKNFIFWDLAAHTKEKFRQDTRLGLSGKDRRVRFAQIKTYLEHAREKIEFGLEKAFRADKKMFPTYFRNEVTHYKLIQKKVRPGNAGLDPCVEVKPVQFKQTPLPFFLEGPVHAFKMEKDPSKRKELLRAIRASALYDSKLEMYKVNAPLADLSLEVGRARVFTPGWLENESVWLHMEYKLLLEILKGGMTDEFFRDFKNVLIPFQPAERYGRNILENSSFIVSSAFLDPSLHGSGFIARLSGSTAEFLTMWLVMNVGKKPFILGPDKKLSLRFEPSLPAFLFTKAESTRFTTDQQGNKIKIQIPQHCLAFMFLGRTLVFYHNPKRLDTVGKVRVGVKKITLQDSRAGKVEFKGDTVPSPYAGKVRDGLIPRIDIELG